MKCIFIEETNEFKIYYRRYSSGSKCKTSTCTHDYKEEIDIVVSEKQPASSPIDIDNTKRNKCSCGYEFTKEDDCQKFVDRVYINKADGKKYTLIDAPIGAMWYADWMNDIFPGPDGRSLCIRTPGGDWMVDSIASNCDKPNNKIHRCWVRHGTPPMIHVDKKGNTCNAGAGSIGMRNYHGFLHNGELTGC